MEEYYDGLLLQIEVVYISDYTYFDVKQHETKYCKVPKCMKKSDFNASTGELRNFKHIDKVKGYPRDTDKVIVEIKSVKLIDSTAATELVNRLD